MRRRTLVLMMAVVGMTAFAVPTVSNETAKQRFPWNGLVDITCTVSGIDATDQWKFALEAVMPDTGDTRKVKQFWVMKNGVKSTDKKVQANDSYKLLWDAQADLGAVIHSNMVMRVTVVELHEKVQLWKGGPYWATTNIGAEEPEDYGYYFWWGDTVGYTNTGSGWISVKDGTSISFTYSGTAASTYSKENSALLSAGYIDSTGNLVPEYDAAHVHWGGEWRMPTDAEFSALISNCTTMWITTNGVYGRLVTGKGAYANRSIFLPAAGGSNYSDLSSAGSYGFYWSSTPRSDDTRFALRLYFSSGSFNRDRITGRYNGQSVRPVRGFAE